MTLTVINDIGTAPGVRPPKVPASWVTPAVLSAEDADAMYRNDPRWAVAGRPVYFSLEAPAPHGGRDIRDDRALGLARDIVEVRPGRALYAYTTRGPRGLTATSDDLASLKARVGLLMAATGPLDLMLYRLVESTGGALAPEIYPFRTPGAPPPTPDDIRLYAMRRTAWTVPLCRTMPTVCWRGLAPFMVSTGYGAPWNAAEWQAHLSGMVAGGAAGYCIADYLTSDADVTAFEKWVSTIGATA